MLGLPGSNFIFPIMNQAEESGVAAKLLAGVIDGDAESAGRDLARIAALSMLQEPPDHAPYGWSHCLTMPQAVIALAGHGSEPRTAIAVAATHVVGFRAALGERSLDADYQPERPATTDLAEAIATGQDDAAATVWHAPEDALDEIVTDARNPRRAPSRRASREVHARVLRRGRRRSEPSPPLPLRRGLAVGVVGAVSG